MDMSLRIARAIVKERILDSMKSDYRHTKHERYSHSGLVQSCLRRDTIFRVWEAVFDEVLTELVKEGKVLEKESRNDKGNLRLRYELPEADRQSIPPLNVVAK